MLKIEHEKKITHPSKVKVWSSWRVHLKMFENVERFSKEAKMKKKCEAFSLKLNTKKEEKIL